MLASAIPARVLLPMPGAPPSNTSDPGTKPPPSTRSSSAMPVPSLSERSAFTSRSGTGLGAPPDLALPPRTARAAAGALTCSSVFQAPQPAHCPVQVRAACPHSEQRYWEPLPAISPGYGGVLTAPTRFALAAGLFRVGFDDLAEEEVEEGHVVVERSLIGIDQMLHGQPDVQGDHRGRDLLGGEWRLLADLLEGLLDLRRQDSSVAAPESRGELAELLVAGRLGEALEPEPEEPLPPVVLLNVPHPLDPPAQPLPRGPRLLLRPLGHLGVLAVDAVLEQLDEELILACEVGVEGAACEAGLGRDLLHARSGQAMAQEDALRGIEQAAAGLGLLLLAGQTPSGPRRRGRTGRRRHLRRRADSVATSPRRRRTKPRRRRRRGPRRSRRCAPPDRSRPHRREGVRPGSFDSRTCAASSRAGRQRRPICLAAVIPPPARPNSSPGCRS